MNGRGIGEVAGVVLLATVQLVATGILFCIGWHLGSKVINRLERKPRKGLERT